MRLFSLFSLLALSSLFLACNRSFQEAPSSAEGLAKVVQSAHGLEVWWGHKVLEFEMAVDFGGNRIVEGQFFMEAHGPRAKYVVAGGPTVYFDGSEAYQFPAEPELPRARFHVLTWPWFVMAPLKVDGEGTFLSQLETQRINGAPYTTVFQTFSPDSGDSPQDWYRYFVDPETYQVEALSYIVSFGKSLEEAEQRVSLVYYGDYTEVEGVRLARDYVFYTWDPETNQPVGTGPKGRATVSRIGFTDASAAAFDVPEGARLLPLP